MPSVLAVVGGLDGVDGEVITGSGSRGSSSFGVGVPPGLGAGSIIVAGSGVDGAGMRLKSEFSAWAAKRSRRVVWMLSSMKELRSLARLNRLPRRFFFGSSSTISEPFASSFFLRRLLSIPPPDPQLVRLIRTRAPAEAVVIVRAMERGERFILLFMLG